ncbi:MAG: hypothetical protein ACRDOT_01970 [Aeromicrobium sp.]
MSIFASIATSIDGYIASTSGDGPLDRTARLRLAECRSFGSGIVLLRYERFT